MKSGTWFPVSHYVSGYLKQMNTHSINKESLDKTVQTFYLQA
jgi:hypothetical protein